MSVPRRAGRASDVRTMRTCRRSPRSARAATRASTRSASGLRTARQRSARRPASTRESKVRACHRRAGGEPISSTVSTRARAHAARYVPLARPPARYAQLALPSQLNRSDLLCLALSARRAQGRQGGGEEGQDRLPPGHRLVAAPPAPRQRRRWPGQWRRPRRRRRPRAGRLRAKPGTRSSMVAASDKARRLRGSTHRREREMGGAHGLRTLGVEMTSVRAGVRSDRHRFTFKCQYRAVCRSCEKFTFL